MMRSIANPSSLMEPDLSDKDRWGGSAAQWGVLLADTRAFRVRGFTSFRQLTGFKASQLGAFIAAMEEERQRLPGWQVAPFDWNENFAGAQINAAMKMHLLRFDKAAKVVLTCLVAARSKGLHDSVVLDSLRIEPAAFGLLSFTPSFIESVEARTPGFGMIGKLADACGQPRDVIEAMLRRRPVTYRLARAVEQFCSDHALVPGPGAIVTAWTAPWIEPCGDEIVGGLSDPPLGIPIRDLFNGLAA